MINEVNGQLGRAFIVRVYDYQAWSIPFLKPVGIRLCRAGFPFARKPARCANVRIVPSKAVIRNVPN
jgi:hypothetical protein